MTIDAALRERVRTRAGLRCEYCRVPEQFDPLPFQIDHIIARKHHGASVERNLSLSCFACNNHKGPNIAGIDPVSAEIVALFDPRREDWDSHFQWKEGELVGLTPAGRATVDVLCINLPRRLAFRKALIAEGVSPR